MPTKDADRIADSEDPEQSAPQEAGSPGTEDIKLFMLNSAEYEIYPAHKC